MRPHVSRLNHTDRLDLPLNRTRELSSHRDPICKKDYENDRYQLARIALARAEVTWNLSGVAFRAAKSEVSRNECDRNVAATPLKPARTDGETLIPRRLAEFKFPSICSSFLFPASCSRNKVKRAGLTRTITTAARWVP